MGTIIEISFFMLIAAGIAFTPLAYFIHNYIKKDGNPFGDFEHPTHEHSIVDELVEKVKEKLAVTIQPIFIWAVERGLMKKKAKPTQNAILSI